MVRAELFSTNCVPRCPMGKSRRRAVPMSFAGNYRVHCFYVGGNSKWYELPSFLLSSSICRFESTNTHQLAKFKITRCSSFKLRAPSNQNVRAAASATTTLTPHCQSQSHQHKTGTTASCLQRHSFHMLLAEFTFRYIFKQNDVSGSKHVNLLAKKTERIVLSYANNYTKKYIYMNSL